MALFARTARFPDGDPYPETGTALPMHTDVAWRAPLAGAGRGLPAAAGRSDLGDGLAAFHDDPRAVIEVSRGPEGVWFDVAAFEGTYLSLVLDLPDAFFRDLGPRHMIRAEAGLVTEGPAELYLRLNLRIGPNTRELPERPDPRGRAAFDLAHVGFVAGLSPRGWLDVIFSRPGSGRYGITDLVLSRAPRPRF